MVSSDGRICEFHTEEHSPRTLRTMSTYFRSSLLSTYFSRGEKQRHEYVCVRRLGGTTPAVYILTSILYFILVKNCLMPVGVEDGRIPAEAFTASSYHSASFLPNRGRLNLLPNGGKYCWAAKQNNANQWLQVRNDSPGHF